MNPIKILQDKVVAGRLAEEELYGQVAQEIAQGIISESLWAKAVAQGNGSMDRAHSIYIKLRVQDLSDGMYILNRAGDEISRQQKKVNMADEFKGFGNDLLNIFGGLLFRIFIMAVVILVFMPDMVFSMLMWFFKD